MTPLPPAPGVADIVVPGSVANLGPGFDALSVAVQIYLQITVLEVLPESPELLEMTFDGGPFAGENRIATAFTRAKAAIGEPTPGLRVRVESAIPMRAGLGSSAAATVAGLRLYEAVTGPRPVEEWLGIATAVEGHPDNAAAALLGGLALSCQLDDGRVIARRLRWPETIKLVVATPDAGLETAFARKVLPDALPMRDAVFNLQRALLLVSALERGDHRDLREALRDRWHQPSRQQYVPGLADAIAIDHPAVLGACLSGAGPSIAVLAADRHEEAAAHLQSIYTRLGVPCTIRTLSAHQ